MLKLNKNEKILLVLHRHWIVIAERMLIGLFLLVLPYPAAAVLKSFAIPIVNFWEYFWFATAIYSMLVTLFIFLAWIDYYLDEWIITTERIIDIEQHGLFRREISEFMISRVQDVTVKIPNIAAMLLKYGDIEIQTAGEKSFSIKQIPHVYEAKDIILSQARIVPKQNQQ